MVATVAETAQVKVDVRELEPCKRQLVVEAPEGEVAAAWEAAFGRVQRRAQLPGFRRGKVPRSLVRAHFADEVRRAVAEQLVPDAYRRALDEAHLDPVEEPEVRDLELAEGQPLRFTAVVEVKPTFVLGGYRGLTVHHVPGGVSDADVEAALAAQAERQATLTTAARAVRPGDFVLVDYTLDVEGSEARTERGYLFEAGGGRVLAELDEAVLGLSPGDERQVHVRLPDSHPQPELRGRAGRLALRVIEVKEKETPALDDEFAKALGDYQGLAELRQAVRRDLETLRERHDRHRLEEAVLDAVIAAHEFAVPESLVLREVSRRIGRARDEVRRGGVDPETLSWDYPKLAEELRPAATRAVRRVLLLEAIAAHEGIGVSEAELEAEVERLAQAARRAPQALRSLLEKNDELEGLRLSLRDAKTLAFLVEHADIRPQS
jgi:trigger factor